MSDTGNDPGQSDASSGGAAPKRGMFSGMGRIEGGGNADPSDPIPPRRPSSGSAKPYIVGGLVGVLLFGGVLGGIYMFRGSPDAPTGGKQVAANSDANADLELDVRKPEATREPSTAIRDDAPKSTPRATPTPAPSATPTPTAKTTPALPKLSAGLYAMQGEKPVRLDGAEALPRLTKAAALIYHGTDAMARASEMTLQKISMQPPDPPADGENNEFYYLNYIRDNKGKFDALLKNQRITAWQAETIDTRNSPAPSLDGEAARIEPDAPLAPGFYQIGSDTRFFVEFTDYVADRKKRAQNLKRDGLTSEAAAAAAQALMLEPGAKDMAALLEDSTLKLATQIIEDDVKKGDFAHAEGKIKLARAVKSDNQAIETIAKDLPFLKEATAARKARADQDWTTAVAKAQAALAIKPNDAEMKEIASGGPRIALAGHDAPVRTVAFTSNGQSLVSADTGGVVRVWSLKDRTSIRSLSLGEFGAIQFGASGNIAATSAGAVERRLMFWNLSQNSGVNLLDDPAGRPIRALALRMDGGELAASSDWPSEWLQAWGFLSRLPDTDPSRLARHYPATLIFDMESQRPRQFLSRGANAEAPVALAYTQSGAELASVDGEGIVTLWSAQSGEARSNFATRISGARRLQYSRDGETLAIATDDTLAVIRAGGDKLYSFAMENPGAFAFLPDGRRIAVGAPGGEIQLRSLSSGEVSERFRLNAGESIHALAASPDGQWIAAGTGHDPMLMLWRLSAGGEKPEAASAPAPALTPIPAPAPSLAPAIPSIRRGTTPPPRNSSPGDDAPPLGTLPPLGGGIGGVPAPGPEAAPGVGPSPAPPAEGGNDVDRMRRDLENRGFDVRVETPAQ